MKKLFALLVISFLTGCSSSSNQNKTVVVEQPVIDYVKQGDLYLRQNDFENAEINYRLAIQNGDNLGIAGLGLMEAKKGNLKQELYYYEQAYSRNVHFAGYLLSDYYMRKSYPRNCQLGVDYLIEASFRGQKTAWDRLNNIFGVATINQRISGLDVIYDDTFILGLSRTYGNDYLVNAQQKRQAILNSIINKCQKIDWNL